MTTHAYSEAGCRGSGAQDARRQKSLKLKELIFSATAEMLWNTENSI